MKFVQIMGAALMGACKQIKEMLECGAEGHDNTACCEYKDLVSRNREVCRIFCNPTTITENLFKLKFLPCMEIMKDLSSCYLSHLN